MGDVPAQDRAGSAIVRSTWRSPRTMKHFGLLATDAELIAARRLLINRWRASPPPAGTADMASRTVEAVCRRRLAGRIPAYGSVRFPVETLWDVGLFLPVMVAAANSMSFAWFPCGVELDGSRLPGWTLSSWPDLPEACYDALLNLACPPSSGTRCGADWEKVTVGLWVRDEYPSPSEPVDMRDLLYCAWNPAVGWAGRNLGDGAAARVRAGFRGLSSRLAERLGQPSSC